MRIIYYTAARAGSAKLTIESLPFGIVDLKDHNVWALFVEPEFEGQGIGKRLHNDMLDWYFSHTDTPVWLGTARRTRAEKFYRKSGWKEVGVHGKNEIKFEITIADWCS